MTSATSAPAAALAAAARGVVFDKDGTLIDLDARWLPFFESYIARIAHLSGDVAVIPVLRTRLGVEPGRLVPESPAAIDTGARIHELVLEALVERGVVRESASRMIVDAASTAGFGQLTPRGDVAGVLTRLATSGRRLGVATSDDRRNTIAELGAIGVLDLVEFLRCGDDDGPVKPDPEVLLLMAEAWGLVPGELLYVGDSRHDLATARAAGVPFVMVGRPTARAAATSAGHDGRDGLDVGDAQVDTVDELIP